MIRSSLKIVHRDLTRGLRVLSTGERGDEILAILS